MRGKTQEDRRLLELLDPVAESEGYEIVRLRLSGGVAARRLQIMAERPDGSMRVEDCARLARALNPVLDAADPVSGDYLLEVSSPGIDRPLTRLKDFEAYEGFEAKLELDRLAEGRKRFRGELAGIEDGHVAINLEGEVETALLPFGWLVDARLIINDALLRRGADERASRLDDGAVVDETDVEADAPPVRPPRTTPRQKTSPQETPSGTTKARGKRTVPPTSDDTSED